MTIDQKYSKGLREELGQEAYTCGGVTEKALDVMMNLQISEYSPKAGGIVFMTVVFLSYFPGFGWIELALCDLF